MTSASSTKTMTLSDVERAYPHNDGAVGYYVTVTAWTTKRGEVSDMLTGMGATAEKSEAQAAEALLKEWISPNGENTTYLIIADEAASATE